MTAYGEKQRQAFEVRAWLQNTLEIPKRGAAGATWVVWATSPLDALRQAYNRSRRDSVSIPLSTLPDLLNEELDVLYGILDRECARVMSLIEQARNAEAQGVGTSLSDLATDWNIINALCTAVAETRSAR